MKRSEINQILRDAKALFARHSFRLPPLAEWTPEETRRRLAQCPEIRDCQLGWDVTDFGQGRFAEAGLLLLGNEGQTVGPPEAPMEVHLLLLGAGVVLLEGIVLRDLEEGRCFLNAAPLNLSGADGSPCRAWLSR